jgi:hypothetical protein
MDAKCPASVSSDQHTAYYVLRTKRMYVFKACDESGLRGFAVSYCGLLYHSTEYNWMIIRNRRVCM